MGCVQSKEEDEALQRCKERRRLMKELLDLRDELAAAHMAYLQSLRNTGATLRQFIDVETMTTGSSPPVGLTLPPSPPPPPPLPPSPLILPPPPPPPPNFSPISTKEGMEDERLSLEERSTDLDNEESCLPPPPVIGSSWDFWDPFDPPASLGTSSSVRQKDNGAAALQPNAEEVQEDWAETKTEFEEEAQEVMEAQKVVKGKDDAFNGYESLSIQQMRERYMAKDLADDNLSTTSGFTKDNDIDMVVWRSKRTLSQIVKQLDEYFLTAAAGGKSVAVLLESNKGLPNPWEFEARRGKSSKSAKVVNVFSWNWSFKSPHYNKDSQDPNRPCMPGNHCKTLEKLYVEEQKLYKEIKDEEIVKSQHKKIMLLLHRLEAGEYDYAKTERTQSNVEELQCRMVSLQESIGTISLSISKLRDEELFPQLVELCFGLAEMWRTMYECHQAQNHASQQVSLLDNHPSSDPTTDSHCHATAQLENEVSSWYKSFCNLIRLQREYVHTLNQWIRLTDGLPRNNGPMSSVSGLCEQLERALDRLPDKAAAEAIKSFLLVVHSLIGQHAEELILQKRSDRLESRLASSISELEKYNDPHQLPELASKHSKVEAFKKKVEEERAKYLDSVRMSRTMTLRYLQTSLPNVFQALTGFSGVFLQALEGITGSTESLAQDV